MIDGSRERISAIELINFDTKVRYKLYIDFTHILSVLLTFIESYTLSMETERIEVNLVKNSFFRILAKNVS